MKSLPCFAVALLALSIGCSSTDEKTSSSTSSSGTSGTTSSSGDTSGTSSGDPTPAPEETPAPAAVTLKSPKLVGLMKMSGALHVTWSNNDDTADGVEVERESKKADGTVVDAYKVAYKLPATVDNKHDMTATADLTYTYRVRCKKGTTYSEYSNEMSGNPKK